MKTDKDNIENIEFEVVDALIEKPISFTVDGRFFYLYPPSLGVSFLASRIMDTLHFDPSIIKINDRLGLIAPIIEHKEDALRLITIHTFKRRSDAIYEDLVQERMKEFANLDTSEIGSLLVAVMTWSTQYSKFVKHYGIDKERERRAKVAEYKDKKDEGSMQFGGKSIYGRLIDFMCERYKWQMGYVMWGISLVNVNMLMADTITTMLVTKDERRELGMSKDGEVLNADDPKNLEKLKAFFR